MKYSASEAAKLTGLSTATLRYYEKENLLPKIKRLENASRRYTDSDIEWIQLIQCLRSVNIPIRDIREYTALLMQGSCTIEKRLELVMDYEKELETQMLSMQKAMELVKAKIGFYKTIAQNTNISSLTYLDEWKAFKKMKER